MKIEINEELLEHDIVDLEGIVILCPRLLASDVAHEICIDFDEEENISADYVYTQCADKIWDIVSEMVKHVDDILQDNHRYIT